MNAGVRDNSRNYPSTMISAESGRPMRRGLKRFTIRVDGQAFVYNQPGWCDPTDPNDCEGQLLDDDNQVAEVARRSAEAIASYRQRKLIVGDS